MDDIVRGRLKVLFVSPERLASPSFRRLFIPRWNPETRVKERHFPTVSLLCVDEAHCLSQWAHNFRPSYLRMKSMMELIQPQSVLAITATAGPRVVDDICRTLGIPKSDNEASSSVVDDAHWDETGAVRVMKSDRDNIDVCCTILSNQEERLSKVCARLREGVVTKLWLSFAHIWNLLLAVDQAVETGERSRQRKGYQEDGSRRRLPRHRQCNCLCLAAARRGSCCREPSRVWRRGRGCRVPWWNGCRCSKQISKHGEFTDRLLHPLSFLTFETYTLSMSFDSVHAKQGSCLRGYGRIRTRYQQNRR
jgi:hypothetical protein